MYLASSLLASVSFASYRHASFFLALLKTYGVVSEAFDSLSGIFSVYLAKVRDVHICFPFFGFLIFALLIGLND